MVKLEIISLFVVSSYHSACRGLGLPTTDRHRHIILFLCYLLCTTTCSECIPMVHFEMERTASKVGYVYTHTTQEIQAWSAKL